MNKVIAHGKWILSGEHSVIMHHPSVVFPIPSLKLKLSWKASNVFNIKGNLNTPLIKPFIQEFYKAYTQKCDYELLFQNSIPISQGLGFSAALCSTLALWAAELNWIHKDHVFKTAQHLEHQFHTKSSGVDIIGANSKTGNIFNHGKTTPLPLQNFCLYLSYSGRTSLTSECVQKVLEYREKHPDMDQEMNKATQYGIQAFRSNDVTLLKKCLDIGYSCFENWGLIDPKSLEHMNWLKSIGAIACKPTGSGLGGYVISLWPSPPTQFKELFTQAIDKTYFQPCSFD